MPNFEKIRASNDPKYDEYFNSLNVSILAKEAIVASGLTCFDVQTMWIDDKLAAKNQESLENWIESYWAPKPPIQPTEISTDRAFETFKTTPAIHEGAVPQPAMVMAVLAINQDLENRVEQQVNVLRSSALST